MKNYFLIFLVSYFTILATKFVFIFYLGHQFSDFTTLELIYAIFWGIKFDFAASAILAFTVSFFDLNKKIFALMGSVGVVAIFLTQIGNIFYFDESNRHVAYEIFDMLHDAQSLFMTAFSQHTTMALLAISTSFFMLLIFYMFFQNIKESKINRYYFIKTFVIILVSVFFVRGMFQNIPLHPWQANEIGDSRLANVSLNSIYTIVYSAANRKKKLDKVQIVNLDKTILEASLKSIYQDDAINADLPQIKTKPNVVLFFLESWSVEFMSAYGFNGNTTPVYDSLLKKSLHPRFMIANGKRTTEGIFATLTSYQNPLGETIAKTQLQNFEYDSIIFELTSNGYDSAFFQGSSKDTSGTGSLANSLGFKQSYGKKDIKERMYEENYWGVQDTDLYNFIEKKIEDKDVKEPFVLGINGATTHDSITPKGYKKQRFIEDNKLNDKLNALNYSDYALGEFIKNIEEKYPNTIFVLFADHCAGGIKGNMENYMIPFAIYSKALIQPKKVDVVLSQRDIAPTVYDLILGDHSKNMPNFTGKSLISNKKFYADYFTNGILGWIETNDVIELNTITNHLECFVLNNLNTEKIACNDKHEEMKKRALALTLKSQELLFSGETKKIKEYK